MATGVRRRRERRSNEIDAVLMIPAEATRASWSIHELLVSEGYRVAIANDHEDVLRAVSANNESIVFVPGSAYTSEASAVRGALHALESVAVPVVFLGQGWQTRVRDGRGDAAVAVGLRARP